MNELHDIGSVLLGGLVVLGTMISSVWFLRGWFHNQFLKFSDKMDKLENSIITKLEYHERHDDERFSRVEDRFSNLRNDIWSVRLELARKNGKANKEIDTILRNPSSA